MSATSFTSTRFGVLETDRFGACPFPYFMPAAIPRDIELDSHTHAAVSRADLALGRSSGLAMLIDDPELLLAPAMVQAALSSSRIEGTQVSLSDVLGAASAGEPVIDADLQEVSNYLDAAKQDRELLRKWPPTGRLFCALYETLLTGSRGEEKYPGELRRSPVWIGSPNARPSARR